MINFLFSPRAGSGAFVRAALEIRSIQKTADGTRVADVETTGPAAPECPHCGARRHMTGMRMARFRDIPWDGYPLLLCWRRRHFTCTGCNRPSHETFPGLREDHRVTARLV